MPVHTTKRARHAWRRWKTRLLAKRRRDEHLVRAHFDSTTGLTEVDCVCELADTYFAKRTAFGGCRCRKRMHGAPRRDGGTCKLGSRGRIYKWRQETCELRASARAGRWEPGLELDEVVQTEPDFGNYWGW